MITLLGMREPLVFSIYMLWPHTPYTIIIIKPLLISKIYNFLEKTALQNETCSNFERHRDV